MKGIGVLVPESYFARTPAAIISREIRIARWESRES